MMCCAKAAVLRRTLQCMSAAPVWLLDGVLKPVSAQVPLLFTIYALVSFREFQIMAPDHAARSKGFFELPPSYALRTLEEAQRHNRQKSISR